MENLIKALEAFVTTLKKYIQKNTMNESVPSQPVPNPIPIPTPPASHKSRIAEFANAIAKAEGAKVGLLNPGDLKVSTLTRSWGALPGFQAQDGGWIAKFLTRQQGFTALCNFLTLGCEDELKAFHQARTVASFLKVYAGNPPLGYIDTVCSYMNVSPDTNINTFL